MKGNANGNEHESRKVYSERKCKKDSDRNLLMKINTKICEKIPKKMLMQIYKEAVSK